jgi:hypothetical protein
LSRSSTIALDGLGLFFGADEAQNDGQREQAIGAHVVATLEYLLGMQGIQQTPSG